MPSHARASMIPCVHSSVGCGPRRCPRCAARTCRPAAWPAPSCTARCAPRRRGRTRSATERCESAARRTWPVHATRRRPRAEVPRTGWARSSSYGQGRPAGGRRRMLVSARLRSWRRATDSVVRSKVLGAPDLGEHRPDPRHRPPVRLRPVAHRRLGMQRRRRVDHARLGELGERRQQVVAQRRAGLGLPAIGARQGADRLPQPHQVERVEQRPLHGGQLGERSPGRRPASSTRSNPVCSSGHSPARSARASGTPAASRDASPDITTSAIRPGSIAAQRGGELGDPGPELGDRRGDVERRPAVAQQPQRAALDHPPAVEEQVELGVLEHHVRRARRSRPTGRRSRTRRAPPPTPGSRRPPTRRCPRSCGGRTRCPTG